MGLVRSSDQTIQNKPLEKDSGITDKLYPDSSNLMTDGDGTIVDFGPPEKDEDVRKKLGKLNSL